MYSVNSSCPSQPSRPNHTVFSQTINTLVKWKEHYKEARSLDDFRGPKIGHILLLQGCVCMSTGIHTKLLLRGLNFLHTGRQPKNKRTSWCELALEQDGGGLVSVKLDKTKQHTFTGDLLSFILMCWHWYIGILLWSFPCRKRFKVLMVSVTLCPKNKMYLSYMV